MEHELTTLTKSNTNSLAEGTCTQGKGRRLEFLHASRSQFASIAEEEESINGPVTSRITITEIAMNAIIDTNQKQIRIKARV